MKDSGIPWIGEIPEDWDVEKIKGFLRKHEVKGYGDATVLSLYRDHGVVPKDSRDDNHNRTGKDTDDYKYVREGDLVINKMKAWQGSLAVSGYEGIVSPAYFIYEFVGSRLLRKYADYLLRSNYKQEFERVSGGIREGQWDLPRYDWEHMPIPLPSLDEQQRIAEYLDTRCREIDTVKQTLSDEIEALQRLRKATIHKAVTKGLDESVPMKDSGIEWIGEVPEHWTAMRLKYLLKERNERSTTGEETLLSVSVHYGVIPSSELQQRTMVANTLVGYKRVFVGDMVFNKLNPNLARFGYSQHEGITSPDFAVYYPNASRLIDMQFLTHLIRTSAYVERIKQLTSGVGEGFSRLYTPELFGIAVGLPPLDEQQRIVDYLDERCTAIDSIIETRTNQLERLEDYRKALIFAYVTGKKEVPAA